MTELDRVADELYALTPGEFDVPPAEPVVLIGEVPWELRDEEA